ncbi:hypothetical protein WMF28_20920 [Sorangium sp. So ce590]|uniref:hypothetical protein n=1 Tax=Sorangium sp. So ce590 TaxID=3133317 RepID=UPI003F61C484
MGAPARAGGGRRPGGRRLSARGFGNPGAARRRASEDGESALAALRLLAGLAGDARGHDGGGQVIVIVTRAGGLFSARVRAELESIGFRVVVRGAMRREVPDGTIAIARIIDGPPSRIEIKTVTPLSQAQDAEIVIDGAGSDVDVGSVQAAEHVRAHVQPLAARRAEPGAAPGGAPRGSPIEVPSSPSPASEPPPAPAPTLAPTPRPTSATGAQAIESAPRRLHHEAGTPPVPRRRTAVTAATDSQLGLTLGLGIPIDAGNGGLDGIGSFWFSLTPRLRIEPIVRVPLAPITLDGPGGTANLYAGMLGVMGNGTLFDEDAKGAKKSAK